MMVSDHYNSENSSKTLTVGNLVTLIEEKIKMVFILKRSGLLIHVTVEGRNQTLFTLSTFEKKSSKSRNFYCRASVMTKVNFD